MQYEFLKQFSKRMKHVGMYGKLLYNSIQKQTWKTYGFINLDEQLNMIVAVLLYIMEQSLKEEYWQQLSEVFAQMSQIEKVILYGSRVKGTYKPFSDIDITLVGENITYRDLLKIMNDIDDLLLPYMFDISIFHNLKNDELIEHINRMGAVVYSNIKTIRI